MSAEFQFRQTVAFVMKDERTGALVLTKEAWLALNQVITTRATVAALQAQLTALEQEFNMSSTCLIEAKYAETVETPEYTALAGFTVPIDSFTAFNSTGAPITISVKIVPAGEAAATDHLLVQQAIAIGAAYTFPEVVGQALAAGDVLSVVATATGLVIRASGRVLAI